MRGDGDEDDGDGESPVKPAAHVSPVMRIYRHALEAICAMLELDDLSRILAVSREWSAAVRSMKPIDAEIYRFERDSTGALRALPSIQSICASPLRRHVAAIHIKGQYDWTPMDNASLALLAQHAPNLTSLHCTLTLTPNEPLMLPAKLVSLLLHMDGEYTDAALNGVLATMSALPSLSRLRLCLSAFRAANSVELSLLAACRSLADVTLESTDPYPPPLSDAQVKQIRTALGHLRRLSVGELSAEMLARLLKPPATVRWQDIGPVPADARTGDLLLRLPSITKLALSYRDVTPDAAFLPQLPQLTSLTLDSYNYRTDAWMLPTAAVLACLLRCTGLVELSCTCGFTSAHWTSLLTNLPSIQKLTIGGSEIATLTCFAAGPITRSLEDLTIHEINLPPSELAHLSALRRLRTLSLVRCFSPRLHTAAIANLYPPTPLLPALTTLKCRYRINGRFEEVERRGSSFEWMQQRQTQK